MGALIALNSSVNEKIKEETSSTTGFGKGAASPLDTLERNCIEIKQMSFASAKKGLI